MKYRWHLAAMISLPLITITAYLLWLWPHPNYGASALAQIADAVPYLLSLLTGLPFAWIISRGPDRGWLLLAFFGGGFVALFFYAVAILCGVRGVCL